MINRHPAFPRVYNTVMTIPSVPDIPPAPRRETEPPLPSSPIPAGSVPPLPAASPSTPVPSAFPVPETAPPLPSIPPLPKSERTEAPNLRNDPVPEPQPAKNATPTTNKSSSKSHLYFLATVLLVVTVIALVSIWMFLGLLIGSSILPRIDLGYSWFDAHVFYFFGISAR